MILAIFVVLLRRRWLKATETLINSYKLMTSDTLNIVTVI